MHLPAGRITEQGSIILDVQGIKREPRLLNSSIGNIMQQTSSYQWILRQTNALDESLVCRDQYQNARLQASGR
jgi:hypothetical protein